MQGNPKKIGKYEIGKVLGKGNFSKVRLATDSTNAEKYAIKIIDKALLARDHLEDQIRREISILKVLRHKYIVQMREAFQTTKHMYVVMELVEGGELFDVVADQGRLSEDQARKYFQQLVVAVRYCHANKIAHRDLKLENLLLDRKGDLKISDFGLANMQTTPDASVMRTVCGTPNYVAPEVIRMNNTSSSSRSAAGAAGGADKKQSGYNGMTADVWSCGIILFIMLSGRQAFDDDDLKALFNKIERGQYQMSRHVPDSVKGLIERMLCTDPNQRITIPDIIKHPWFQQGFDASELTAGADVRLGADAEKNAVTSVDGLSPEANSPLRAGGMPHPRTLKATSPQEAPLGGSNSASPAASPTKAGAAGADAAVPSKAVALASGGLDGFQLANALIASAIQAPPFVDLGNSASGGGGGDRSPGSPSKATLGGSKASPGGGGGGGLNSPGGGGAASSSSAPPSSPLPIHGVIRQYLVRGTAAQAYALAAEWLKSILPNALRGPGSGASASGAMQELRGFITTPRGIMTFVMEVVPTCVASASLIIARKGMGDNQDFYTAINGLHKKLAESKTLVSEWKASPEDHVTPKTSPSSGALPAAPGMLPPIGNPSRRGTATK